MAKLYEISQAYSDVCDAIMQVFEENPDLDDATRQQIIADNLCAIQANFETTALGLAGYIQNLKLAQSNVKTLQDRFTQRARHLDRTIHQLSDYLLRQMQQVNMPKLANAWLTVQIKNNPAKVIIEDETRLSEAFKIQEITLKVNKTAIAERLKAGECVPYTHLEASQRLEIK